MASILNFGDNPTTKEYFDSEDGTTHNIDEFKILGGGINRWFKGFARDSGIGWLEASWAKNPTRSTTAPFAMTSIDDIDFSPIPRFECTMPILTLNDYLDIQKALQQRYVYLTFYNLSNNEWITREMAITSNDKGSLYNFGVVIKGVRQIKLKFVSTQRGLAEYDTGCVVRYNANGGVGTKEPENCDIGEQIVIAGADTFSNVRKSLSYWATNSNGTGAIYKPNQPITIFEDLELYAIWE